MKPQICAAVTSRDPEIIARLERQVDLFEIRIDLIGDPWREITAGLNKPWIACLRSRAEGGKWQGTERERLTTLGAAAALGAAIIDIEINSGLSPEEICSVTQGARCLISRHCLTETPPLETLRDIVREELRAGADICKVVTTARSLDDNITILKLIKSFPEANIVAFAMGETGAASRILCPLVGGYFIYASLVEGRESAPGQLTVAQLSEIYEMVMR